MSDRPFDGALDAGEGMVLIDGTQMAFVLMIGPTGICDMKAADGISREQAAVWLRDAADVLDPHLQPSPDERQVRGG